MNSIKLNLSNGHQVEFDYTINRGDVSCVKHFESDYEELKLIRMLLTESIYIESSNKPEFGILSISSFSECGQQGGGDKIHIELNLMSSELLKKESEKETKALYKKWGLKA